MNGKLLVNFIGSFENFSNDLSVVLKRFDKDIDVMPQDNPSIHKHYSTYYSRESENIIRERFKKDIDYFGYKFERLS